MPPTWDFIHITSYNLFKCLIIPKSWGMVFSIHPLIEKVILYDSYLTVGDLCCSSPLYIMWLIVLPCSMVHKMIQTHVRFYYPYMTTSQELQGTLLNLSTSGTPWSHLAAYSLFNLDKHTLYHLYLSKVYKLHVTSHDLSI